MGPAARDGLAPARGGRPGGSVDESGFPLDRLEPCYLLHEWSEGDTRTPLDGIVLHGGMKAT